MGWKYEYVLLFNPAIPSSSIFPLKSFKLVSSLLVHLTVSSPYQMQLKAKSKTENQMALSTLLDALLVARSINSFSIFQVAAGYVFSGVLSLHGWAASSLVSSCTYLMLFQLPLLSHLLASFCPLLLLC